MRNVAISELALVAHPIALERQHKIQIAVPNDLEDFLVDDRVKHHYSSLSHRSHEILSIVGGPACISVHAFGLVLSLGKKGFEPLVISL